MEVKGRGERNGEAFSVLGGRLKCQGLSLVLTDSADAFQSADCRKTFAELKDQFYGVEAMFKDPFGNWFSMTQPKNY
jgi:hypothetical protein